MALIGAGAGGFQIARAVADAVEHLTVFQRTAQRMFPNPMYHESVGTACGGRWITCRSTVAGTGSGHVAGRRQRSRRRAARPSYPNQDYAVSEINAAARLMFTDWITNQVGEDDDMLAKMLPDYPATGKRTLQDNGSWPKTLRRDNVELVRTVSSASPPAVS